MLASCKVIHLEQPQVKLTIDDDAAVAFGAVGVFVAAATAAPFVDDGVVVSEPVLLMVVVVVVVMG